jgi:thiamine kinase-like enzyme
MGKRISGRANIFWVFMCCATTPHHRKSIAMFPTFRWMAELYNEKAQVPLPIIFGHHDLLPTNFMDDGKQIWLIDWGMAASAPRCSISPIPSNNQFTEQAEKDLLTRYFGANR